ANTDRSAAKSVQQFARRVGGNFYVSGTAVFADPADGLAFFHTRELDDGTILAQRLPDTIVALLVGHIHSSRIRGNTDVVGNEDQYRIRVGVFAVGFDGSQLFVVRSAPKQVLNAADEEHLKRRHQ